MLVKVSSDCPDITVRRKNNTNDEYIVKVNGERIEETFNDGNWSRHIFLAPQYGVVIKIDEDYYAQSRNEIVFWTEKVKSKDKRYFAPVLGWGTTSMKTTSYRYGHGRKKMVERRVFYCVQQYIAGAKEFNEYKGKRKSEVEKEYKFILNYVIDEYQMSDFHYRQIKVNNRGRIKVHDYGLFGSYDTKDLPSDRIPISASVAARKMNKILEKIGA